MQGSPVTVNGETSVVFDSGGSDPAVVLIHGNSHHYGSFDRLKAALPTNRYRFIGIDLPGHGASPPARHPEACYTLPGYADLLIQLIDTLSIPEAVFVGHSLGGHVILESLPDLPTAVGAFVMGTPPVATPADLADAFLPHPAAGAIFKAGMTPADSAAFDTLLTNLPEEDADTIRQAYTQTDPQARTRLGGSIMTGGFRDEQAVINANRVPMAVLSAAADPLINARYFDSLAPQALWRGGVQRLPGCGHWPHIQAPDSVRALLTDFLEDCHGNTTDVGTRPQ